MYKDWIKKNWGWILLWGIVVLVVIPYIIAKMHSFTWIITDTDNEWIGFWGGYLGSILGGAITLFVLGKTLSEEKKARKREEKIKFFNDLTIVWSELSMYYSNMCLYAEKYGETKERDDYEKALLMNNEAYKHNIHFTLLLNTRKEDYDVEEVIRYNTQLSHVGNELMDMVSNKYLKKKLDGNIQEATALVDEKWEKCNEYMEIVIRNNLRKQ